MTEDILEYEIMPKFEGWLEEHQPNNLQLILIKDYLEMILTGERVRSLRERGVL